ncbi:Hypothetical protein R9X50_00190700 [Acrodontium crateriforme]|uniref:Extracellular membrane protein CFEM domain-containing protein n=1 Tax=Acrodontium crateriforme TaxID=150365 RepID=A0AAQ3R675_9PEZI|nr:Hypothetical protein R9X50_00190700 [Acrodontium crateriforme]
MKSFIILGLGLIVSVTGQNQISFPQSVKNLPSCGLKAMKTAMNTAGCSTSDITSDTFTCLCQEHLGSIVSYVALNSGADCGDYPTNYGTMCGLWEVGPSSSDVAAGVTALKDELGGSLGDSSSTTTTASGGSAATTTAGTQTVASASATAATTASHGLAAAASAVKIGEILAPVVAVVALLA